MISWIKLDVNILDDAKIKIIRSHPNGDTVVLLWIGLLCLAMKSARPGTIEISDGLPYTVDDLSNLFGVEKKTVEMGLALFCKYRMIDVFEGGTLEVINFSKHQKIDAIQRNRDLTRERVARHREKQRPCNALLTHDPVTCLITDKDLDKDLDNNPPTPQRGKRTVFVKPTVQEIDAYCQERNNGITGQEFFDSNEAKGWVVGKNRAPMACWRSAVRTWERGRKERGGGMVTI